MSVEKEACISRPQIPFVFFFISNDATKIKVAILAFLYCGEFVKNLWSDLLQYITLDLPLLIV